MRAEVVQRLKAQTNDDTSEAERSELRVIFASTPLSVRDALLSTLDGLKGINLSDDDASTVELVLAEVMNNVVEHAYRDDREGMIELQVVHDANGLICTVLDDGFAMPNGHPPVGTPPEPDVPLALQPEGGFGWFLIRTLAHDLNYSRDGQRNRFSFRLAITDAVRAS